MSVKGNPKAPRPHHTTKMLSRQMYLWYEKCVQSSRKWQRNTRQPVCDSTLRKLVRRIWVSNVWKTLECSGIERTRVATGYLWLALSPVMSGEKQTLHSTVRPSHVAAAPSRFADAVLHRDPFDLQPPRDSAPHERACRVASGVTTQAHTAWP